MFLKTGSQKITSTLDMYFNLLGNKFVVMEVGFVFSLVPHVMGKMQCVDKKPIKYF